MSKSNKLKLISKIGLIAVFVVITVYGTFCVDIQELVNKIETMPFIPKVIAMILLIIMQMIFAFLPGEPLELASGYIFGSLWGTVICLIGSAIGTIFIYFIVKKFGHKIIEYMFNKSKIDEVEKLLSTKKSIFFIFLIFLIPGTPKDVITYVASLAKLKLTMWIIITTIGRIPSIITSTYLSHSLKYGDYIGAFIVLCITAILVVGGAVYYRYNIKIQEN